jgi:hypothetical protein
MGNAATAVAVPSTEMAKIFGRMAEKVLYLDKDVGDCCYSACTDCEWRLPGGGYRFDKQKAVRPKWIPCYLSRDHRVGTHVPAWVKALFPDGVDSNPITRPEFETRIGSMKYSMSLGPSGMINQNEAPAVEAIDLLWAWLSGGPDAPPAEELEPSAILRRLQDMSIEENRDGAIGEGPDAVDWRGFVTAFGIE